MEWIALASLIARVLELILTQQSQQSSAAMGLMAQPGPNPEYVAAVRELHQALGEMLAQMEDRSMEGRADA